MVVATLVDGPNDKPSGVLKRNIQILGLFEVRRPAKSRFAQDIHLRVRFFDSALSLPTRRLPARPTAHSSFLPFLLNFSCCFRPRQLDYTNSDHSSSLRF